MKRTKILGLLIGCWTLSLTILQAQPTKDLFDGIWDSKLPKVKKALAKGANINAFYNYKRLDNLCLGLTPYMVACGVGNLEIVKYLEKKGARIRLTTPEKVGSRETYRKGTNAMVLAAIHGTVEVVKHLLSKGFDINQKSMYGSTPLVYACSNNDYERLKMVKFLVENGADVNAAKTAALFDAARRGYNRIIKYLLDKDAHINAIKSNTARLYKGSKITPIYYAISIQSTETVKLLIERGAKVDKIPGSRIAPLHLAAYRKALYCAALLVKNGANPQAKNYKGQTPAQVALEKKAPRIAAFLDGTKPLTSAEKNILKYKQGNIKGFEKMSFATPDFQRRTLDGKTFTDLKGKKFTMKDLRGKIVFVNIWATWCQPCLAEMPEMIELQNKLKGKPFVILTFAVDKARADLERFQQQKQYPFMIVHDEGQKIWNKVLGGALPSTHIFDTNGKKMVYVEGAVRWSKPQYVQFFKGLMK
ncbi:MAG TPA: hypothetical protein DCS93_37195 [Microscillaceae bacterium]|nr:hypothetical protein [Microscillaceae bacterium]